MSTKFGIKLARIRDLHIRGIISKKIVYTFVFALILMCNSKMKVRRKVVGQSGFMPYVAHQSAYFATLPE
jgi:hypothetical protein